MMQLGPQVYVTSILAFNPVLPNRTQIFKSGGGNTISWGINTAVGSGGGGMETGLNVQARTGAAVATYFLNGASFDTDTQTSSAPINGSIYLGARNTIPATAGNFSDCAVSSVVFGAAVGFNHQSFYDDLVILNDCLAALP